MHVYLREQQVSLRMEAVDGQGLVPDGSELLPMAFFADQNAQPSFRALLPLETVEVLRQALRVPVTLGVLAEEPEEVGEEIHAMVGLAMPIPEGQMSEGEEDSEPWRASAGSSEAWRGEEDEDFEDPAVPRTALLAFAPLVRLSRRFPDDFANELADLLESALSGATRPALEARVDRMLGEG
jgi:hypothetical protein